MNQINDEIKVLAFDADATLWDCQSWFDDVERRCCELLSPWTTAREVSEGLVNTERKNLSLTGYGTKAFTLSLIENAVRVTHEQLTGAVVQQLLDMGKELLEFPTTPLPEVEETLKRCVLRMEDGHRIAQAAYDEELFEPVYGRMLLAGERSGSLEHVLGRLTELLEENCGNLTERLVGIIDPLLSGVLMFTVGLSLLSVMLPLIGMMNSIA